MYKEIYFWDFFNSLLEGNKFKCKEIMQSLIDQGMSLNDIYTEMIQKSMYRIGKMWDEGKINVADEHVASRMSEYLVDISLSMVKLKPKVNKKVLISCIDKEFHDIGARIATNIFEYNGWDTIFLGANIPRSSLLNYIESKTPEIVGLSVSLYVNYVRFTEVLEDISQKFPNLKIIIGGQGLNNTNGELLSRFPNVKYFHSINELDDFIKSESSENIS